MISVDFFDKRLDPPDYPTRSDCDGCGCEYDNGDLTRDPGDRNKWYCDDCFEEWRSDDRA